MRSFTAKLDINNLQPRMKTRLLANIVALLIPITVVAQAQNKTYLEYIETYKDVAITEMENYGIPASITMAQGLLESGAGRSELTRKSNNHFGIKCGSKWTGGKEYYDDDAKHECFRKYSSALESYEDHSQFLKRNPRYASLFQLSKTDYKGWAYGLKKAGYATNPKYPQLLINLIETYNLSELDGKKSSGKLNATGKEKKEKDVKDKKKKEKKGKKGKKDKKSKYSNRKRHKREGRGGVLGFFSQRKKLSAEQEELNAEYTDGEGFIGEIDAYRVHQIKKVNGVKCVEALPGDTYEAIAEEFGKFESEIFKANDVQAGATPKTGTNVFIKKKKKEGKGTYEVQEGETLYDISQKVGVRLRSLYRINDLVYGKQVKEGDIIRLK